MNSGTSAAAAPDPGGLQPPPIKHDPVLPELNLFGGPLYRLGSRLGLVRGRRNTVLLGIALGPLAWVVLTLLMTLEGSGSHSFSIAALGIHVRLLLAVPLFFICETWVVRQMEEFTRYLVHAGLVGIRDQPDLSAKMQRTVRISNSFAGEVLCLLLALGLPLTETLTGKLSGTASWASILRATGGFTWASDWYLLVCLPLCRFLIFRWIWKLGSWGYFLWLVEKIDLHLIPIHSDESAGLGYLEIVHERFTPLAAAVSAILSAQFAEGIYSGNMSFESLYPSIPLTLLLNGILFIGPLCIFSRKLWICRWTGMQSYMTMAGLYVGAFDRKWMKSRSHRSGERQLGTPDLQSLADLTNSVRVVTRIRIVPAGRRLLVELAIASILPLAPLLLLKYPIDQVLAGFVQIVTGL